MDEKNKEEKETDVVPSTITNEVSIPETEPKVESNNTPFVESVLEVPTLEANVQENTVQVPVKRGRGRPRKDGSNPRPSGGVKKAPQNIIYEPTIKTRRQKGINVPLKNLKEEYSDEMEAEDDKVKDADFSVESEMRGKVPKIKFSRMPSSDNHSDIPQPAATNSITEALKATQKLQEEYEASLKEKYAVSFSKIQNCSPLDKSYSASGILLRDIVSSLTGAIGETIQESSDAKQPSSAVITAPKGLVSPWPEVAANTVWSCPMSSEEAKQAALHLAYGDFIDLSVPERIDIISSLVYEALESKLIGNEINKRMEKQLGMKLPFNELCTDTAQLISDLRDQIQLVVESEAKGNSQSSGTLKEWMAWVEILRVGMKRYVGEDFNGRRYWALGNESGAFRIFCQDLDAFSIDSSDVSITDSWGYYEGESLEDLISWLGRANIRKERILLASLCAAPVPTSLPTPSAPARKLSGKELLSQQADGYRNINYPLLRGEWNLTSGSTSYDLPIEQRASLAIESILGTIPFWFKVSFSSWCRLFLP